MESELVATATKASETTSKSHILPLVYVYHRGSKKRDIVVAAAPESGPIMTQFV